MKKLVTTIAIFVNVMVNAQTQEWEQIGATLNLTGAAYNSLEFDNNGNAYYLYSNPYNNFSLNVQKFDGISWSYVGGQDFINTGFIYKKDIAFDSNGVPYVVFVNGLKELTVIKYNGTSWDTVGTSGFAQMDGLNGWPDIEIDWNNNPVVAFKDFSSLKLSVMNWDGSSWVFLNNGQYISIGSIGALDMSIDIQDARVFVGFVNGPLNDSLTIYNTSSTQSSWSTYGNSIVSNGPINTVELDVTISYEYVAYINSTDNNLYVHRLVAGPTQWEIFPGGPIGLADSYTDIAIKRVGQIGSSLQTLIGFSDTDQLYSPTIKSIGGSGDFTSGNINVVGSPGFDDLTPDNIVFGTDQNDSLYVAFGKFDIKVFKLRAVSQVGIKESNQSEINIYPNPLNNQFTVSFNDIDSESTVEIISLDGKILYQTNLVTENQKIDVSDLVSGTYFVRIKSISQQTITKIIIEK